MKSSLLICITAGLAAGGVPVMAAPAASRPAFVQSKTCFQTNTAYDPRIALAVDGVIVHRHGEALEGLKKAIGSWKEHGFSVGRMFFSDSDANCDYWKGRWDGKPHDDEVEKDAAGNPVLCAGIRPYMLPTPGWTAHLEEMTRISIEAGADAVLPEEPLAHVHTGYEGAFKPIWEKRYGREWEPEKASPAARFFTAQLKGELYLELERKLAQLTKARARELGREISFVLPVHAMYSNLASQLVAPMGAALAVPEIDAYIGQVWTGPVNWALAHYSSPDKSFFTSAYCLYDYFVSVADGSGKKMFLLADPVEDDPNHTWAEFEQWYRHCVVAKLMFPSVDSYEVMPWPDRIFLPGHATGGSTPAPAAYRTALLSAVQVLQEVPAGGTWVDFKGGKIAKLIPTAAIGIAMADSLLYEREAFPMLEGAYGCIMPLIGRGIPASACVMERTGEPAYLSRFKVIVLSYELFKPTDPAWHTALAKWVNGGGSLVVLGGPEGLGSPDTWWAKAGDPSPLHHLAKVLGFSVEKAGEIQVGRGRVFREPTSPRALPNPKTVTDTYLPLLGKASRAAGAGAIRSRRAWAIQRGPYLVVHALNAVHVPGRWVDVLDAGLPVLDGVDLKAGQSGLYKQIPSAAGPVPVHCTHRLMSWGAKDKALELQVRGPVGTPGAARLTGGDKLGTFTARTKAGAEVKVDAQRQGETWLVQFDNDPEGVTISCKLSR